jgi:hypothetical protein
LFQKNSIVCNAVKGTFRTTSSYTISFRQSAELKH